jgi:hypothetical protein
MKLPQGGAAVLADLDYGVERELKNEALRLFWRYHKLPGRPEPIVDSPKPRHYRTTSKRRCRYAIATGQNKGKIAPGAIFVAGAGAELLEPEAHGRIFAAIEERLSAPVFGTLARALNFVIIRGSYEEFMIVFNLHTMDRGIHRLLSRMADFLRELNIGVISAFAIVDPSRSPYYLEGEIFKKSFPGRRLFGPDHFRLHVGDVKFSIPPFSFSQVNESILPLLVAKARNLMAGGNGRRLLDLYCGYGLFAFTIGAGYREVLAVEAAAASIRAGNAMAAGAGDPAQSRRRVRFIAAAIGRRSLETVLPSPLLPGEEDVILDPPRQGVDGAVIGAIARRRPGRVLHLFCAVDEIPEAIGQWRRNGYFVRRVVPLDMFAGTPQLETMILLSRQ